MRETIQPLISEQSTPKRHPFWWLIPTSFAWPATFLYLGTLLFGLLSPEAITAWWHIPMLAGVVLALLLVDRGEYWRYHEQVPARVAFLLLIVRILLIVWVVVLEGFHFAPTLYLVLPYFAMVYFGTTASYAMAVLVNGVYFAWLWWKQPDWYLNRAATLLAFLFFFGVLIVVFMARTILQEKASRLRAEELLMEVKHSHRQLQAYAEEVATLATAEERNRLAREIHDSLGHTLTAITVQLEKALVYYEKHPQEAMQAISDAKQVAREALRDVRRSVHILRTEQEPFSCAHAMVLLVTQLRASSLVVEFVVSGSEAMFSRQVLMTLYRTAQEGFTNIQKHAQASTVQVQLHFVEEEASLSIHDNGQGFDMQQRASQSEGLGKGFGLQGIQERIALLGGHFHLESQIGDGTYLTATVPRIGIPIHLMWNRY